MHHAACSVSIAPVRAHPSDKSEMVTQLLFGESASILEEKDQWALISCTWDGYEGWVDKKQLVFITPSEFLSLKSNSVVNMSLVEGLMASDHFMPITMGATLPGFDGLRCHLAEKSYQFSGAVITPGQVKPSGEWIAKIARRFLHAPYLWGGRSPFGIDCSGLTQMVYKIAGIPLMRDASQQVLQGHTVDFMEECTPGDLAFFDNGKGDITHVGIMLADCHIIHASGKVRIDKVDHFGIFSRDAGKYTHQLRIIRRLVEKAEVEPKILIEDADQGDIAQQMALFS